MMLVSEVDGFKSLYGFKRGMSVIGDFLSSS